MPIDDIDVRNMIEIADRKNKGVVDIEDFMYVMECAGLLTDDKDKAVKKKPKPGVGQPSGDAIAQADPSRRVEGLLQ